MSRKPKGIDIPWIFIILAFVFGAWPIGVVLVLLRELPISTSAADTTQNSAKAADVNAEKKSRSAPKKKKNKKKQKSGKVTILRIVAVALVVLGVVAGLSEFSDMIAYGFGSHNIENLMTALYFVLGGCASWLIANVFHKQERETARYAAIIGEQDSVSLMKISSATSHKLGRVKRDIQNMIDDGLFGDQAYIDHANLCFMRTPEAKPDGVAQTMDAQRRTMSSVARDLGADAPVDMSDYDSILKKIRCLDEDIVDESVSARIRRIESITRHIFHYVNEKPEKKNEIRMFMNYYLPTTLKLLESYRRIEQVGVAGQNMRDTKDNIEKILDMLVVGFEGQMDQLFKTESLDITSDIEVLEQMMNKDGLTDHSDFVIREEYSDEITDDLTDTGTAQAQRPMDM